jgi:hypothetical protein
MRKPRSNSNWNQLTCPQREMVEKWLFQEHLSYDETRARVKTEFGLETSPASVGRYYRRRARERQMADLVEAQAMSDAVAAPELSTDSMRAAAVKLVAKTTLKLACERPDQLKELEALAKILLLSEDNDIRRGRLKLEEQQFHYEAASAASEEIPHLASLLLEIQDDEELTAEAKMDKVHALLFPESARLGLHKMDEKQSDNGI